VPLPPLSEQHRIVGILDQAFEGIAQAKANAERNLANAKELLESELESLYDDKGAPEVCFHDICEITSVLVDPKKSEFQRLPHIGAGNIASDTGQLSNVMTAAEEKLISGKFLFDSSMVLYSKIRPYLKKVSIPDFDGLCSADIYPLKPKAGRITRAYLFNLLLTKSFTEYAISGSDRAGMPKVNRDHLFAFRTRLPNITRQEQVVARLASVREMADTLRASYENRLSCLQALQSSLLHQAFNGNL
jgi:type I restriction enzyme S subunit